MAAASFLVDTGRTPPPPPLPVCASLPASSSVHWAMRLSQHDRALIAAGDAGAAATAAARRRITAALAVRIVSVPADAAAVGGPLSLGASLVRRGRHLGEGGEPALPHPPLTDLWLPANGVGSTVWAAAVEAPPRAGPTVSAGHTPPSVPVWVSGTF